MAANSQQFRPATEPMRRVHELSSLSLEDKTNKLTNIVQTLLIDKMSPTRLCKICTKPDHPTDSCLILHEGSTEQVNAVKNFSRPPQKRYDPYSNSYNVGWKDHPNLSYGSNPQFNQPYQQRLPLNQQLLPPKSSLETIVERLANSTEKFQLPSQTEPNLRHNVSAITLRSGKVLEPVPGTSRAYDAGRDEKKLDTKVPVESAPQKSFAVPPPFPRRLIQCKKERDEKKIFGTF
ncbi:hypothetical protein CXB51_028753 [Gossypium anomalum]|uniref:Uncharacterized protein n=1 Tax=Gossypium anomalum TaxID=47600 RepID=A0A8J5YZ55_9ROSI|nr:hypothetical protein CXB51_028753 [Gossypium anomalum]